MLNGLILCGGKSSRLGIPKYTIQKNGLPLYEFWIEQLIPFCDQVFISSKKNFNYNFKPSFIIYDEETDAGPLEGIYQAFKLDNKSNWLIVAVDLVYANREDIQTLVSNQSEGVQAICYENPETKEPFPLLTIYNSNIVENLNLEYFNDRKSAKQLLLQSNIRILYPKNDLTIRGINTKEELNKWKTFQNKIR